MIDKDLLYMIKAALLDSIMKNPKMEEKIPGFKQSMEELIITEYDIWKHFTDETTPLYKQS